MHCIELNSTDLKSFSRYYSSQVKGAGGDSSDIDRPLWRRIRYSGNSPDESKSKMEHKKYCQNTVGPFKRRSTGCCDFWGERHWAWRSGSGRCSSDGRCSLRAVPIGEPVADTSRRGPSRRAPRIPRKDYGGLERSSGPSLRFADSTVRGRKHQPIISPVLQNTRGKDHTLLRNYHCSMCWLKQILTNTNTISVNVKYSFHMTNNSSTNHFYVENLLSLTFEYIKLIRNLSQKINQSTKSGRTINLIQFLW